MNVAQIAQQLRQLADELDRAAPVSAPAPAAPVAPPAQAPAPPPDNSTSYTMTLQTRQLDPTRLLTFSAFTRQARYNRFIPVVTLGATPAIEFCADNRDVSPDTFLAPSYTLTCDGVPVATAAAGAAGRATFRPDLSGVADGWHLFDIVPSEGPETPVPLWMFVRKGATLPEQTFAPVQMGSWGYYRDTGWMMSWAQVPVTITAQGWPLPPRAAVPFSTALPSSAMFARNLVPCINGDPVYLRKTTTGLLTCMNDQAYAWSQAVVKTPSAVLRDGPRGVGTAAYITHMQVGRRGSVYALDCWRLFNVDPTGAVQTLAGWRSSLDSPNGQELVGDWSAVPSTRHGFHEPWGFAWVPSTVSASTLNTNVPPVENGGVLEHPHTTGPRLLVADAQNGRIAAVTFDPASHAPPAVVTELMLGLADPWDIVASGNGDTFFVSERQAHRVIEIDAQGQVLRTVIQRDPALPGNASIDKNRKPVVVGTLAERRAQPVLAPEGLFVQDGELFIGSFASQQVIAVNIATGARRVACLLDNLKTGAIYVKLAMSDGSFGPRGTVFVSVWDVGNKGAPYAFLPDGTRWNFSLMGSTTVPHGRGGLYSEMGYSMSSTVSGGRLYVGSADYGIREWSQAQAADPAVYDKTLFGAGRAEYERKGYRLTHGVDGCGQFGYPLPWGESAAMDYYLTVFGHARA